MPHPLHDLLAILDRILWQFLANCIFPYGDYMDQCSNRAYVTYHHRDDKRRYDRKYEPRLQYQQVRQSRRGEW